MSTALYYELLTIIYNNTNSVKCDQFEVFRLSCLTFYVYETKHRKHEHLNYRLCTIKRVYPSVSVGEFRERFFARKFAWRR